jgi:hypothetical protein
MTSACSDPPAVQQVGGSVLVQGQEMLAAVYRCVCAGIERRSRNGLSSSDLAELQKLIRRAHVSATRHENAVYVVAEAHSDGQGVADWISVAEAAAVLALSRRQTQRLAQQLALQGLAERIGTTWALRKAPVLALKLERERKAQNG